MKIKFFTKIQVMVVILSIIISFTSLYNYTQFNQSSKLQNLKLDEKVSDQTANTYYYVNYQNLVLENLILNSENITLINCTNFVIRNNFIENFSALSGIYLKDSSNGTIENNTISNLSATVNQYGLTAGLNIQNSYNITISNNSISNINAFLAYGIGVSNSKDITIFNNNINGLTSSQTNSAGVGIILQSSNNTIIHANNIQHFKLFGILSSKGINVSIVDNVLANLTASFTGSSVEIMGIASTTDNNLSIINNTLDSFSVSGSTFFDGIHLNHVIGSSIVINNRITNFKDSGATIYNSTGIKVDNLDGIKLINNTLTNFYTTFNSLMGISLNSVNNAVISNNKMKNFNNASINAKFFIVNGLESSGNNNTLLNNSFENFGSLTNVFSLNGANNTQFNLTSGSFTFSPISQLNNALSYNYSVFINGVSYFSGSTQYGVDSLIDLSTLSPGTYTVVIHVNYTNTEKNYFFTVRIDKSPIPETTTPTSSITATTSPTIISSSTSIPTSTKNTSRSSPSDTLFSILALNGLALVAIKRNHKTHK